MKFDNKLKLAKRKQETADTKKSAKKQEADPQIEHPESLKNRLTRIGAEADPLFYNGKGKGKVLGKPYKHRLCQQREPSSKTQRDIDDVFNEELSIFSSINAMLHEFLQHYKLPVIYKKSNSCKLIVIKQVVIS